MERRGECHMIDLVQIIWDYLQGLIGIAEHMILLELQPEQLPGLL